MKISTKVIFCASFLLSLNFFISSAQAASTPASQAKVGKSCIKKNLEAVSLQGALVCNGKKWVVIQENKETIQSKAFRSVLTRWNKQPNAQLSLDIYADPKAGNWTQQIEAGIRAGARFWGTSDASSRKMPVIISDDHLYIEKILEQLGIPQSAEDKERNAKARGGQAGFHGAWDDPYAYWDFLFRDEQARNNSGFWQVPAHEYTHFAQSKLSNRNWSNPGHIMWMDEGIPSYIGAVLGPMSKMPHDIMNAWRQDLSRTQVNLEFFTTDYMNAYSSPSWSDVYPMGAVASEGLVALVGVTSIISYYTDLATGISLPEAFEKNFGTSDVQMTSLLDRYIKAIKTGKPWNLKTLQAEFKKIQSLDS